MPLQPGYGETPLSGDELDALLAHVVDTLGPPVSKADIFDLESAILQDVAEYCRSQVLSQVDTPGVAPNQVSLVDGGVVIDQISTGVAGPSSE